MMIEIKDIVGNLRALGIEPDLQSLQVLTETMSGAQETAATAMKKLGMQVASEAAKGLSVNENSG